jgi:hypothetical protein
MVGIILCYAGRGGKNNIHKILLLLIVDMMGFAKGIFVARRNATTYSL